MTSYLIPDDVLSLSHTNSYLSNTIKNDEDFIIKSIKNSGYSIEKNEDYIYLLFW